MKDKRETLTRVSDQALEWVMHDVLDGLLELSLQSALSDDSADFQIIEIAPESEPDRPNGDTPSLNRPRRAKILPFPVAGKTRSRSA